MAIFRIASSLALLVLVPSLVPALAADSVDSTAFPTKPITMIVPFPAGGGGDTLTRLITQAMTEELGQTIIVDNRPGAGGNIGAAMVAKAKPDGYTLLSAGTWLLQAPHLHANLQYDIKKDLIPVSQIAISNSAFFVSKTLPTTDLASFIELVKKSPEKYSFGSFGIGTSSHLYGESLNKQAGLGLTHVPYQGGAKVMTDLIGGQIQAAFVDMGSGRPYFDSDRVRLMAVSGSERSPLLPALPTFAELGYDGLGADGWIAFFAPSGTPEPVLKRLSDSIARALARPEIASRLQDVGFVPKPTDYKAFAEFMVKDGEAWRKIIASSGLSPQ